MKRFLFCWLTLCLGLGSMRADETVRQLQAQLKRAGFFQGQANGVYDEETATAVSRYQIRNGLAITGCRDSGRASCEGPKKRCHAGTGGASGHLASLAQWRYAVSSETECQQNRTAEAATRRFAKRVCRRFFSRVKPSNPVVMDPHAPPPPLPEIEKPPRLSRRLFVRELGLT
jgi:peptidoglycan hydrolase-like protein with peptidoglycan-binding domain